jgi:hypothetical protein
MSSRTKVVGYRWRNESRRVPREQARGLEIRDEDCARIASVVE